MKHIILTVLAAVCLTTAGCWVQPYDAPGNSISMIEASSRRPFKVYLPSSYDPNLKEGYPLLISLHGTPPWDPKMLQEREFLKVAEEKKFIVVTPELTSSQGILPNPTNPWMSELASDEAAILAIRSAVIREFNVNRKRILLTGFSAGGYAMYYTGLRNPDKFEMLIGRAANSDSRIFEMVDWKNMKRRIPVYLFCGKDDSVMRTHYWRAFRWLRRHGWDKSNSGRYDTLGGHIRRPYTTWQIWNKIPVVQ